MDDEPLARERLKHLLKGEAEIVGECDDGPSAVEAALAHRPDVVFLDIQMPGMDGFEVLRQLDPRQMPEVVFVTAFDQHAVQAFEARALDYLMKPASKVRCMEALRRANDRLAHRNSAEAPQQLLELLAEREAASGARLRRISVRSGERLTFVSVEAIDWIEAAGNYVVIHAGKENHILRETMAAMEAQLPSALFLRVSRSAILNLRRVREIQVITAGEHVAILQGEQRVTITRSVREVEERLRFA